MLLLEGAQVAAREQTARLVLGLFAFGYSRIVCDKHLQGIKSLVVLAAVLNPLVRHHRGEGVEFLAEGAHC